MYVKTLVNVYIPLMSVLVVLLCGGGIRGELGLGLVGIRLPMGKRGRCTQDHMGMVY